MALHNYFQAKEAKDKSSFEIQRYVMPEQVEFNFCNYGPLISKSL